MINRNLLLDSSTRAKYSLPMWGCCVTEAIIRRGPDISDDSFGTVFSELGLPLQSAISGHKSKVMRFPLCTREFNKQFN